LKYASSLIVLLFAFFDIIAAAQSTGTLRGQVFDPSGAVVTGATVAILQSGSATHSATTNNHGVYEIGNLSPGLYTVTANAQGFTVFVQNDVRVDAGQVSQFNISLEILVEQQKVNVQEQNQEVQINPQNNASTIVLSGKDLEALPDDPDELQSDLEALAGPSAGPDGGQLYIDGFTAGQLPPKSAIREIRVNQNPFSAEYDKLGYGRIEIFTKPGSDKFHGQFAVIGNNSSFNSRNPFLGDAAQAPYDSVIYMGNIGGPINKKASFFFDVQRRNIDEIAIVDAPSLGLTESVSNPRTHTTLGPRIDYQFTPNNTLTARYQYHRDTWQNAGVGGIVLPEAGYNTFSTEHSLQITDTQVFGAKAVNETRFQYMRDNDNQTPVSNAVGINVLGAFIGGGAASGAQQSYEDHYELQNYTSISAGKHLVKFGVRVRAVHNVSTAGDGFNGTYTFATLDDFTAATPTPSQLLINATNAPNNAVPTVTVNLVDTGLYIQDDWKVRPTLTLSGGLRFETQNEISDHADWGPRVGFAWGIGGGGKSSPKTVLRGGFGLFYDRFTDNLVSNAARFNGVTEQQYVVDNPEYVVPPPVPTSSSVPQTTYQIASNLRSPYIIQTAVSMERQITKSANATLTYLNSRGVHGLMSLVPNSPEPDPPIYPFNGNGYSPVVQYSSVGLFRQNQLIANFNVAAGTRLSLQGFYSLNYADSDPIGSMSHGTFTSNYPSDSHHVHLDYGRAPFAIRNRLFFGGTVSMPHGFRLSPFMVFNSGVPYNVTTGMDLAGTQQFNVRPAFAPNPTGVCVSPLATCHYTQPTTPFDQIPINYLTGPNLFTLNLRLTKTFGFGPETGTRGGQQTSSGGHNPMAHGGGGGGSGTVGFGGHGPGGGGMFGGAAPTGRRYNLTLSINARNVLNRVNPGTPIGVYTSEDFGKSVSLAGGPFSSPAANRKLELQAMFSF
jgi:hypothetical protein